MKLTLSACASAIYVALVQDISVLGCSYSVQRDMDGNLVAARSMELSQGLLSGENLNLKLNVSYYPANTSFLPTLVANESATDGSSVHMIGNKYAFVAVDQNKASVPEVGFKLNLPYTLSADGMNEHGLTISTLVLDLSEYEKPLSKNQTILSMNFNNWVLGNAASVAEVIDLLSYDVAVASCDHGAGFSMIPKAACQFIPVPHWAIEDATGESIVVEYVGGKLQIHDNTVGTLTNDPDFEFMTKYLAQYRFMETSLPTRANMENFAFSDMQEDGIEHLKVNNGFTLMGLPGDSSPASRFAKLYLYRSMATKNAVHYTGNQTTDQVLVQQQAVLTAMYLPWGMMPEGPGLFGYTIYSTLKVPHRREFYFHDYKQLRWKKVSLDDMALKDLTEPVHLSMAPPTDLDVIGSEDITGAFV